MHLGESDAYIIDCRHHHVVYMPPHGLWQVLGVLLLDVSDDRQAILLVEVEGATELHAPVCLLGDLTPIITANILVSFTAFVCGPWRFGRWKRSA